MADLTVIQLKALLKERGLPTTGRKADLVARLDGANSVASSENATTRDTKDEQPDENDGALLAVAAANAAAVSSKHGSCDAPAPETNTDSAALVAPPSPRQIAIEVAATPISFPASENLPLTALVCSQAEEPKSRPQAAVYVPLPHVVVKSFEEIMREKRLKKEQQQQQQDHHQLQQSVKEETSPASAPSAAIAVERVVARRKIGLAAAVWQKALMAAVDEPRGGGGGDPPAHPEPTPRVTPIKSEAPLRVALKRPWESIPPPQPLALQPEIELTVSAGAPRLKLTPCVHLTVTLTAIAGAAAAPTPWDVRLRLAQAAAPHTIGDVVRLSHPPSDSDKLNTSLFRVQVDSSSSLSAVKLALDGANIKFTGQATVWAVHATLPGSVDEISEEQAWRVKFPFHFEDSAPGARPDTVVINGLPSLWFKDSGASAVSLERVSQAFGVFGSICAVDITSTDDDLLFTAFVQFDCLQATINMLTACRGRRLTRISGDRFFHVDNITARVDLSEHFSASNIRARRWNMAPTSATSSDPREHENAAANSSTAGQLLAHARAPDESVSIEPQLDSNPAHKRKRKHHRSRERSHDGNDDDDKDEDDRAGKKRAIDLELQQKIDLLQSRKSQLQAVLSLDD